MLTRDHTFCEHVEHLLSVCNQRLYLPSQLRKQGLSDKCTSIVYDAIVLSKAVVPCQNKIILKNFRPVDRPS